MVVHGSASPNPSSSTVINTLLTESFIVCYHYPCFDGIFAALAAYLRFKHDGLLHKTRFQVLTVYEKNHPDMLGELKGNETLFMLDFTGGPGFVNAAAERVKEVVVLDHHKTAQEELQFGCKHVRSPDI